MSRNERLENDAAIRDVSGLDRTSEGNPVHIKVLMYHQVVESTVGNQGHSSWVSVADFRQQMELLDRWGFSAITLNDYRLFLKDQISLPRKPVVISFDDGYEGVYRLAYPVLEEYGMKAVMFVLGERKIRTNFWDKPFGVQQVPLMSGQQIVELHENGFEIGSHSMTHPRLPFLPEDEAWEEISRSRMHLEILLNAPVLSFSYPYGLLNSTAKRMVSDAGYLVACSGQSGPPQFGKDHLEIRRIPITSRTGRFGFAMRMLGPYQYYSWIRWKTSRTLFGPFGRIDNPEMVAVPPSLGGTAVRGNGEKENVRTRRKERKV